VKIATRHDLETYVVDGATRDAPWWPTPGRARGGLPPSGCRGGQAGPGGADPQSCSHMRRCRHK
jgi:hypothetical protein